MQLIWILIIKMKEKKLFIINYGLASQYILKSMIENVIDFSGMLQKLPFLYEIGCCTKLVVEIKENKCNICIINMNLLIFPVELNKLRIVWMSPRRSAQGNN